MVRKSMPAFLILMAMGTLCFALGCSEGSDRIITSDSNSGNGTGISGDLGDAWSDLDLNELTNNGGAEAEEYEGGLVLGEDKPEIETPPDNDGPKDDPDVIDGDIDR